MVHRKKCGCGTEQYCPECEPNMFPPKLTKPAKVSIDEAEKMMARAFPEGVPPFADAATAILKRSGGVVPAGSIPVHVTEAQGRYVYKVYSRYTDKLSYQEFVRIMLLAAVNRLDAAGFQHPDKGGCYTDEAAGEVIGEARARELWPVSKKGD